MKRWQREALPPQRISIGVQFEEMHDTGGTVSTRGEDDGALPGPCRNRLAQQIDDEDPVSHRIDAQVRHL
ncbi:MAG: hypothetical protein F4106_03210 [Gemmatimonadetes bacterium]|nr:hypothetical protein [Gemmatimonadota bacterium]MYJ17048.1 hypothetical protein [Gemmatimonadota bacterium]